MCAAHGVPEAMSQSYRWLWDLVGGPALKKIDATRTQPCAFIGGLVRRQGGCAKCFVYQCKLMGSCTTGMPTQGHAFCMVCPEFMPATSPIDLVLEKLDAWQSLNVIGVQKAAEPVQ